MTNQQERHLSRIKAEFIDKVDEKYRAGVEEHGGNLWEMELFALLDEAMKESVDEFTYLFTAKEKIREHLALRSRSRECERDGGVTCRSHLACGD